MGGAPYNSKGAKPEPSQQGRRPWIPNKVEAATFPKELKLQRVIMGAGFDAPNGTGEPGLPKGVGGLPCREWAQAPVLAKGAGGPVSPKVGKPLLCQKSIDPKLPKNAEAPAFPIPG